MFDQILNDAFNNTIRKHVIAFGSLFNSIYVQTTKSSGIEKTRVPLHYGAKEKFIQKIISESGITDKIHVQMTLPRMGFELTDLQYDPVRRINKLKQIKKPKPNSTSEYVSFSESPYLYNYNVYVFSRSNDHNLQIIEQVVPFFTPDFTVTMNMNPLFTKVDVPIVLTNVQVNDDYEGTFDIRRSIVTVMSFSMKGYIYSPIKEQLNRVIENVDVNLYHGDLFVGDIGWTGDPYTGSITWAPGNTG